jgi:hypothetical protein
MVRMPHGELLTKLTVWLALIAYTLGTALSLNPRHRARPPAGARWSWTLGGALFLAHVVCAFTYFHHWSHDDAYRETARQTAELTGWPSGGGLYLNYLFAATWLAAVLHSWFAPESFRTSRWIAAWHAFVFFMMFNGAVIFVHGPTRWLGILLCATLAIVWLRHWRSSKAQMLNAKS